MNKRNLGSQHIHPLSPLPFSHWPSPHLWISLPSLVLFNTPTIVRRKNPHVCRSLPRPTDCNPATHPLHLCLSTMGNESRILATNPCEKAAGALKRKRQGDCEKTDRGEVGGGRQSTAEGHVNSFEKWLTCTDEAGCLNINIIFRFDIHKANRNVETLEFFTRKTFINLAKSPIKKRRFQNFGSYGTLFFALRYKGVLRIEKD